MIKYSEPSCDMLRKPGRRLEFLTPPYMYVHLLDLWWSSELQESTMMAIIFVFFSLFLSKSKELSIRINGHWPEDQRALDVGPPSTVKMRGHHLVEHPLLIALP